MLENKKVKILKVLQFIVLAAIIALCIKHFKS